MSARTTLVLTDRAATPVAHNYEPDGDDANGVHLYSERSGVPAGRPSFSASMKKSSGKIRQELRLAVPIVQTQTVDGIAKPVIVRTAYVTVSATFSDVSLSQERNDAIGMMASALSATSGQVWNLLVNCEDIY